jgi:hypothetical protein
MEWLGLDLSGLGQVLVNMVMSEMIFEMRGNFLPCLGELLSLGNCWLVCWSRTASGERKNIVPSDDENTQ